MCRHRPGVAAPEIVPEGRAGSSHASPRPYREKRMVGTESRMASAQRVPAWLTDRDFVGAARPRFRDRE